MTTEKQTAFERLFFRLAEIAEIVNLATAQGKKKPEVISMIKERFQDLKDIGDSSFNNYIYTFPFVFNELNKVKQANLVLNEELDSLKQQLNTSLNNLEFPIQDKESAISELNSIKQDKLTLQAELDTVKQQLNTIRQAKQGCLIELDTVKQQLNSALNKLETAEHDRDKAISELNSIKQTIKHSEVNDMNGLNNELNRELNMPTDTDKFAIFIQETEQKFVELNNRIKQLESNEQAVKQIKQTVKQKGLNNVGKWNVVESGGYYRAFRNIDGKNVGIYIGKDFSEQIAIEKITAKGYSVGD